MGNGKSFLINSILNETDKFPYLASKDKSIVDLLPNLEINGKIGIVTQNHWLKNQSIRENILFGSEFYEEHYLKCLNLC